MSTLVRYIKFPFIYNTAHLKADINKIISEHWINHYNTNDYTGNWSSIALMSQGGKSDNIYALPTSNTEVKYTDTLQQCDYFKEILEQFKFQKTSVRLLRLAVGAEIKPHKDYCLGYEDGCFRIHIPIITNDSVEFILDNERLIMNEGECWYIDANFTHSVINNGNIDRIHLVIDGIRNEWTDNLFFQNAHPDAFERSIPKISSAEKKLMIAELQKMNTPIAVKLIADLENEDSL